MDRTVQATPDQLEGDSNLSPRRDIWNQRHLGDEARALLNADATHFLHQSLSSPCLDVVVKAEGIWLEDSGGRRYMDFHGNSAHHIGYGHPRLIAALKAQFDDLPFVPRRFTAEPAVALAAKLAEIAPGDLGKVLLAPSGSDAIEIALKLARAATGRFKTVSFWDSFHGAGFGGASVGGQATFRSDPIGPLLAGTEHVAPYTCYRCPYGHKAPDGVPDLDACAMACASMVRYVLEKEGDVAAVIAEPVRAVPYVPPPGFWQAVRRACDDHGALLIFDEIPGGLGKTGAMFASEHFGVVPDIAVLGKALGGATVPVAAVIANPRLDVAGGVAFGHYTHEKNPLLCRAALTTIEIIEDEGLVENARVQGDRALERLHDMAARHPLIGNVRGLGLLMGVDLVDDRETRAPALEAGESILYRALGKGLSFKLTMGNVLTLTPPLTITESEMDSALDIIEECLSEEQAARR